MTRRRQSIEAPEMDGAMTPMIDVVFQLLIYFLVTFSTPDVLAHLDISRPAPDPNQTEPSTPPKMIRVNIYARGGRSGGFELNDRAVTKTELERVLSRLASLSSDQTVLVTCAGEAVHSKLVDVLDLCAGCGLSQLSVVSAK